MKFTSNGKENLLEKIKSQYDFIIEKFKSTKYV